LAALDRDDHFFGLLAVRLYVEKTVHPAVAALLAAFIWLGTDHRQRPFLKLIFVLDREHLRAAKIFWLADNVELDTRKCVFQATLDEMNCKMRDVDADPAAIELLCGVDRGPAAAKRIEDKITFVGGPGNDSFEKGERLLGGVTEALLGLGVDR
jgi:hypothetical protein